ncbi:hypothetical protein DENSPDRAFT_887234 [Dentipellis sp. KUC8613]|nr:hypothetical protein DENSPDRAFT_887234 [Dentipellis sp. KUC8613]
MLLLGIRVSTLPSRACLQPLLSPHHPASCPCYAHPRRRPVARGPAMPHHAASYPSRPLAPHEAILWAVVMRPGAMLHVMTLWRGVPLHCAVLDRRLTPRRALSHPVACPRRTLVPHALSTPLPRACAAPRRLHSRTVMFHGSPNCALSRPIFLDSASPSAAPSHFLMLALPSHTSHQPC